VNMLIHTCDYTLFLIHRYTVGSFLSLAKTDASVSAVQLARQVFEVCCSGLQRVADCCSLCGATCSSGFWGVLQRVAACCSVLQRVATCCRLLQTVAVSAVRIARQVFGVCCSVLQRVAACCSVLQRVAACFRLLQSLRCDLLVKFLVCVVCTVMCFRMLPTVADCCSQCSATCPLNF